MTSSYPETKVFQYGWYGDGGLGEAMIQMILAGRKTATVSPAYDSKSADRVPGDELPLLDKHGNVRGKVVVTSVELAAYGSLDDAIAQKAGLTLADLKAKLCFANGRQLRDAEEMRVVQFRLVGGAARR